MKGKRGNGKKEREKNDIELVVSYVKTLRYKHSVSINDPIKD